MVGRNAAVGDERMLKTAQPTSIRLVIIVVSGVWWVGRCTAGYSRTKKYARVIYSSNT